MTPIPSGWEYQYHTGARIRLSSLHRTSAGLVAWVELWAPDTRPPDDQPVTFGRRDLTVPASQQVFVKEAETRHGSVPWSDGCDIAFYQAIIADQNGATTVDLATHKPEPRMWVLEPFIEHGGHTRLIAPGEAGKSFWALAAGLTIATGSSKFLGIKPNITGPVLYLDWETDVDTHARRLHALCRAVNVAVPGEGQVIYQQQEAPLGRVYEQIQRTFAVYGIVFAVVDSTMLARGGSGARGAEDSALEMFAALRTFRKPCLLLDHKNKDDIHRGRRGGYGSVVNQNTVRLEWEMTKLVSLSPNVKAFTLSLEKANNVGRLPPLGYQFTVTEHKGELEGARFYPIDPADLLEDDGDGLSERLDALLRVSDEPVTVKRLEEMLGDVTAATIRHRLNGDRRFVNVAKRGAGRWRLTDQPRDDGIQPAFTEREVILDEDEVGGFQATSWEGDVF